MSLAVTQLGVGERAGWAERGGRARQRPEVSGTAARIEWGELLRSELAVAVTLALLTGLVVALGLLDVPGWYGVGARRVR